MNKMCPAPLYVRERPKPPLHDGEWFVRQGREDAARATAFASLVILTVAMLSGLVWWLT